MDPRPRPLGFKPIRHQGYLMEYSCEWDMFVEIIWFRTCCNYLIQHHNMANHYIEKDPQAQQASMCHIMML